MILFWKLIAVILRLLGYVSVGLGVFGLTMRTIVVSAGIGIGPNGHELQQVAHLVAAIGHVIAGYVLIRLTEDTP